ncbi:MAG: DNA mismatch repair protein MutS [Alphaproteobacteria bacterium]|nr:DNA mismatch repair protein MutS [Alphaproteobacteria bacterium]
MTNTSLLAAKSTPMMKQYFEIKEAHSDCLLLFRMGDFYELFFEDAITASPLLGVVLTRRGKAESQDIPMCGIPHHSSNNYIRKLISNGHKVAICDQLETPQEAKNRGAKVVKREVVRIITPGTITEDNLLEDKKSNYLLSLTLIKNQFAISYVDISTLEFFTLSIDNNDIQSYIAGIDPSEIIISDSLLLNKNIEALKIQFKSKIVTFADSFFELNKTKQKVLKNFNLHNQSSLNELSNAQISSCGSLIEYISITQNKECVTLNFPKIINNSDYMIIDRSAQNSLELLYSKNNPNYSLFKVIDRTITNHGSRLLKQYIAFPSVKIDTINNRLLLVQSLLENSDIRNQIRDILKVTPDLERSLSKLAIGRGSPNDLYTIYQSLLSAHQLADSIENLQNIKSTRSFDSLVHNFSIKALLEDSLMPRDMYLNQNDFINHSYNHELSELYNFRDNAKTLLENLKNEYKQKTGIPSLKIEYNNVIGYYIEITKSHLDKIISEEFVHKQTMINCSRFVTEKLKTLENRILSVNEEIAALESSIFNEISTRIVSEHTKLIETAKTIAFLDVIHSFASIASENNYCKPQITEDTCFDIQNGRHPVVENALLKSNEHFVPNNCNLEHNQRVWLITGPNMAGKSTFLRQNAIISVLAHMGSYVPAKSAKIGIIDRIFSRIGTGDDLAQGQSTFLVEMIETATILNQATESSLIILDEIGRGTSTYDGMAIAFSCLKHIHNKVKARTLFSTHYHEMIDLSKKLESIACHTVKVKEWENEIIFMHKLEKGVANKSYGINVAELAGIPDVVINSAKSVLHSLNTSNPNNNILEEKNLSLFDHKKEENKIELEIKNLNIDELTPKQALDVLYRLKEKC